METPAAVFRGNANTDDGQHRSFVDIELVNGKQRGGINAGLMVLTPSKSDEAYACPAIEDEAEIEDEAYACPAIEVEAYE